MHVRTVEMTFHHKAPISANRITQGKKSQRWIFFLVLFGFVVFLLFINSGTNAALLLEEAVM